jgi:hypothetical protein
MNRKIVGIFVITLMIITFFPLNGVCEYKDDKVNMQNNSNFGIYFANGIISDLSYVREIRGLSIDSKYYYFVAEDLDIKSWSKNNGLINSHLNDEMVRFKKPFFGIINENRILGFLFYPLENVYFIKNIQPPEDIWEIPEGDCGESCIWSILNYYGIDATKEEINSAGGDPGRGLHGDEVLIALDHYNINYNDLTSGEMNSTDDYAQYLQTNIVDNIKVGRPTMIGVKVYPDNYPQWYANHFILIIGYTLNDELVFNSDNVRYSIEISKLLDTEEGLSLINNYGWIYCLEFPLN